MHAPLPLSHTRTLVGRDLQILQVDCGKRTQGHVTQHPASYMLSKQPLHSHNHSRHHLSLLTQLLFPRTPYAARPWTLSPFLLVDPALFCRGNLGRARGTSFKADFQDSQALLRRQSTLLACFPGTDLICQRGRGVTMTQELLLLLRKNCQSSRCRCWSLRVSDTSRH